MNVTTTNKPADDLARLSRSDVTDGERSRVTVHREGGKYGAGAIFNVALATVGEALGHEMWLDGETMDQIVAFSNVDEGESGLKSRFTHPGMSSDGLGRHLGRLFNVRRFGDQAIGDLHFQESAHKTPDGDLASYVMDLATEDPAAAGLSIVFYHDAAAEDEFEKEHSVESTYENYRGDECVRRVFTSPDPDNKNNYPHVRIKELRAADIVDEPAANPSGLFDRSPLARRADNFLSYVAGISDEKFDAFDVDGDRAKQFFTRWLTHHNFSLVNGSDEMSSEPTTQPTEPTPEITRESLLAEQAKYVEAFGAENGVSWFTEGVDFETAQGKHIEALNAKVEAETARADEAESKLSQVELGEETPVDTTPIEATPEKSFASRIRVVGEASKN